MRFRPAVAALLSAPCLFVALSTQASPPLSRLDAALDLSTPEAAVRTYSEAFAADDFLAVYFALDPAARERFWVAVSRLLLDDIVSPDAEDHVRFRVLDGDLGPYEHQSDDPNPFLSHDIFHVFEVVLWSADQLGIHAVDFAGPVSVESVGEPVADASPPELAVDARDIGEGAVRFLLRQSPSGRWRVLSVIARPGQADEAVFLAVEEER